MEFRLPEMGEGVAEGELVAWKVKPGDKVTHDQVLVEIMTDKATVEVPSPFDGVVEKLEAKEGDMVEVESVILTFEGAVSAGASAPEPAKAAAPKAPEPVVESGPASSLAASAPKTPAPTMSAAVVTGGIEPHDRILAAPSTRRMASEYGIDLGVVKGTGPEGRVMKDDVQKFLAGGAIAAGQPTFAAKSVDKVGTEERIPFRGLRRAIAKAMRTSKDKSAHFTYVEEADATALVQLRKQAKELGAQQGIKVTFLPFIMKAMVAALKQYPIMNSSLDEDSNEIVVKHYYNIGLSIQTDDGLTAPVIHGVDQKSILQIAHEINELVERARAGKLTQEDFKGGTITLTNAGSIGGLFATPVINFPEVAILGFNKIFKKPVVKTIDGKDEIVIRDWTYFSISLDHRIVDGAIGAHFMNAMIKYIENPSLLVLEG